MESNKSFKVGRFGINIKYENKLKRKVTVSVWMWDGNIWRKMKAIVKRFNKGDAKYTIS